MSHGLYHKCRLTFSANEFQGENELLGFKGWQPHRTKLLTARDGARKDSNKCTARGCRFMVFAEHSLLFPFAVALKPELSLGCHSWRPLLGTDSWPCRDLCAGWDGNTLERPNCHSEMSCYAQQHLLSQLCNSHWQLAPKNGAILHIPISWPTGFDRGKLGAWRHVLYICDI